MTRPFQAPMGFAAAAALLALSASAASAQQYFSAPPQQQAFQQAPAQQALQSAGQDLASVYAAYGQPQSYAQPAQAQSYVQPAQSYVQPQAQAQLQQATPGVTYGYQPQTSAQPSAAPLYNPAPAAQPQPQTYAQNYAQSYAQPQQSWTQPQPAPQPQPAQPAQAWQVPPPAPLGGGYVQPAQPQAQTAYPGYGYAPQAQAYVQPAPQAQPAGPSLSGWERSFAGNIEAVNACLKATALTDVSVNGVLTESTTRETHVILNGRFSASTPPRREFCAWSPTRREARMLDATGRPLFEGEGSPSYAPVGARFSFANLAALQPVVDTDYRLLGWMRWEKTGVQPASSSSAPPAVDIIQPIRIQGYRWS